MNQNNDKNKSKIIIIVCIVVAIIASVICYILITSNKYEIEDEKFNLNDDRVGKIYFDSGFDNQKITSNLDNVVEHTFTLNNINYTFKAKYHLDYKKYVNASEDLDISLEHTFYINDTRIDNLRDVTWVAKFDDNYLIAGLHTSANSTYYIFDINGNVVKQFINSAVSSDYENEYPRIEYQNGIPTQIVYFSQDCYGTFAATNHGIEYHIPYSNGVFGTETATKNKNLIPDGIDICM